MPLLQLDWTCNARLHHTRPQRLLNAANRIVTNLVKYNHITDAMKIYTGYQ